ncbi:hypothetical protein [Euryhalocaulis caribicus]|uniref:hypothetical protein n=1 Tax=Euryhalocaulis caribicus TaxID=1161401 RepID=UPI00039D2F7B|nr:hypothetical protein [Euryhalocaulis caribicus]
MNRHTLSDTQIVPGIATTGVFNSANLETAQAGGLTLFWSHRLQDLVEFIGATKGQTP